MTGTSSDSGQTATPLRSKQAISETRRNTVQHGGKAQ